MNGTGIYHAYFPLRHDDSLAGDVYEFLGTPFNKSDSKLVMRVGRKSMVSIGRAQHFGIPEIVLLPKLREILPLHRALLSKGA